MSKDKHKIRSQRPSGKIPYSPEYQPDIQVTREERGHWGPRYVPDFLQDKIEGEFTDKLGLKANPRSIINEPAGVYALRSADGTLQNLPPHNTLLMAGTFPVSFNSTTNTFEAIETPTSFEIVPAGIIPEGFEVDPNSFRTPYFDNFKLTSTVDLEPSSSVNMIVLRSYIMTITGTLVEPLQDFSILDNFDQIARFNKPKAAGRPVQFAESDVWYRSSPGNDLRLDTSLPGSSAVSSGTCQASLFELRPIT